MSVDSRPSEPVAIEPSTALSYADSSTPDPDGGGVTRRDVATLAVKVVGVYMILQAFPALVSIGQLGFSGLSGVSTSLWAYYLGMLGFYVGLGVLLLVCGQRIASRVLPKPTASASVAPAPWSPAELQAVAFSVLGVTLIVVWGLPGLVFDCWRNFFRNSPDAPPGQVMDVMPYLVRHVLELSLGLWLFYGSKRLSLYWQRLRSTARGPDEGPL